MVQCKLAYYFNTDIVVSFGTMVIIQNSYSPAGLKNQYQVQRFYLILKFQGGKQSNKNMGFVKYLEPLWPALEINWHWTIYIGFAYSYVRQKSRTRLIIEIRAEANYFIPKSTYIVRQRNSKSTSLFATLEIYFDPYYFTLYAPLARYVLIQNV